VSVRLSAPLFNGGVLRAGARRADARYRAIDAYSALVAAESESAMVDETVALAMENLRLSRRACEVGAGAFPDVLDAQRQANLARRTQASHLLALARLHGCLAQPQNGDEQITEERDAAALGLREAKLLL
jgi:outer membrane protein TolC